MTENGSLSKHSCPSTALNHGSTCVRGITASSTAASLSVRRVHVATARFFLKMSPTYLARFGRDYICGSSVDTAIPACKGRSRGSSIFEDCRAAARRSIRNAASTRSKVLSRLGLELQPKAVKVPVGTRRRGDSAHMLSDAKVMLHARIRDAAGGKRPEARSADSKHSTWCAIGDSPRPPAGKRASRL